MSDAQTLLRSGFDRVGLVLSGVCAVHCLATLAVVAVFGLGGSLLLDPAIHRYGLAIAIVVAAGAIGLGVARHRRPEPLAFGAAGIALMALALATGHGPQEAVLTIAGVALLALGHWRNLRHLAG
ncbi:MAG: MerC domain-containing protein [Novosphingobium sp.]